MEHLFIASGTLIVPGVITAISVITIVLFGGKRLILRAFGYHVLIDIVISVSLTLLAAGTFSGLITAAVATLLIGFFLWLGKGICGYERFSFKTMSWEYNIGW